MKFMQLSQVAHRSQAQCSDRRDMAVGTSNSRASWAAIPEDLGANPLT